MHRVGHMLALVLLSGLAASSLGMELKWCCKEKEDTSEQAVSELDKCNEMKAVLNSISNANGLSTTFACVERTDCTTTALKDGYAHIVSLDAGEMYANMKSYQAIPVVSESYTTDGKPGSYNATVYMKADQCTDSTSMGSLRNRRACSTGYGKTAGWRIPMGMLMEDGVMNVVNDDCNAQNDAESAAAFFSEMCVPDVDNADVSVSTKNKLCRACAGDCGSADPYAGYSGAFRGLAESKCDVAFAKHTTLHDVTTETWWIDGSYSQSDYKVLCPFGGCVDFASYDQHQECAWAEPPSHAAVINPTRVNTATRDEIQQIFAEANDNVDFQNIFFKVGDTAVNANDLIFKSSTKRLDTDVKKTMRQYLGHMYEVYAQMERTADTECSSATYGGAPGADGADGVDGRDGADGDSGGAVVLDGNNDAEEVPLWGIVVFILMAFVLVAFAGLTVFMVRREKQGKPLFNKM